jgi:alpha-tubulin suppressor-like RCC1 family protein
MVVAWGANNYGQLGNNGTTDSSVPVAVYNAYGALAGRKVTSIAAGRSHNLVLCADGTVVAWGKNDSGQLGNTTTTNSRFPVLVSTAGVLAGKPVVAVAAGGSHSLALCANGTVAAWGSNYYGQLGNNGTNDSKVPVAVSTSGVLSGRSVVAIAAGTSHSLALCADGAMAAWGDNFFGQLGYNGFTNSYVPVAVTASGVLAGTTVTDIAAGGSHCLVKCANGTAAAWGYNYSGQLGNNSTSSSRVPVAVNASGILAGRAVIAVAAGDSHSVALTALPLSADANLAGLTVTAATSIPAFPSGPAAFAASVPRATTGITVTPAVSEPHAILAVNSVPVSSGTASAAIPLVPGTTNITLTVTAEDRATVKTHTLSIFRPEPVDITFDSPTRSALVFAAYDATGNTAAFHLNFKPDPGSRIAVINNTGPGFIGGRFAGLEQGQLVELAFQEVTYQFIANYYGGTGNDLVLQWAGQGAAAWGDNYFGQLGNNSKTSSSVPVTVANDGVLAGKTVVSIATGDSHSLALCANGTVAAWGSNSFGQLGRPGGTSSVPVAVEAGGVLAGKTVVAVSSGDDHNLALCADGTVAAWGYNAFGQLGNIGSNGGSVPVAVSLDGALAGKSVVAVAAGDSHSLALCADGTMVAWGYNAYGQLGNRSTTDSTVPVAVNSGGLLAGKAVVAVSTGSAFNLALCLDGTVVAWGYNGYGQLGNNSLNSSSVPVAITASGVLAGKTVVAVAAGGAHSLALCADGSLAAWGWNSYGQLGNNSTTDSTVPVAVTASGALANKTVIAIAAGTFHSLALCSDGTVAAWGRNSDGRLGDGTTVSRSVPVESHGYGVLAGRPVMAISAGGWHTATLAALPPSVTDPYTQWLCGTLAEADRNRPAITAAQATPAGDGITNLMKYALGLAPLSDGTPGLPFSGATNGYLTLTYRRNKQATDLTYTVQAGELVSVGDWSPATTVVFQSDEADHWLITVRDNVPMLDHPRRFMRLAVSR